MINTEGMRELLESVTGYADKVTYYQWPINGAPALPFVCFYVTEERPFGADNINYFAVPRFIVELYTKERDLEAEGLFKNAFTAAGLFYTMETTYLDDELVQMTVFTI